MMGIIPRQTNRPRKVGDYNLYSSNQFLTNSGIQCPECLKDSPNVRLHVFKTQRGLSHHLFQSHCLEPNDKERIRYIMKMYLRGTQKIPFINYCFEKGYLH